MKKWWIRKDTYMKLILTLLVFVLSAIVLTDLLVIFAGNKMRQASVLSRVAESGNCQPATEDLPREVAKRYLSGANFKDFIC